MHDNDLALPVTIPGTETLPEQSPPSSRFASWPGKNTRRLKLIDKKSEKGLTAAETEELAQLQEECERYLESLHPLPFDALE